MAQLQALLCGLLDLLLAQVAVTGPVAWVAYIRQAQQCHAVVCPGQVRLSSCMQAPQALSYKQRRHKCLGCSELLQARCVNTPHLAVLGQSKLSNSLESAWLLPTSCVDAA